MTVLRDETSTHFAYHTAKNSYMSSEESECSFNYYLDNTLREKYPNTEFFRIFLISVFSSIRTEFSVLIQEHTDLKMVHIWTLLAQYILLMAASIEKLTMVMGSLSFLLKN